MRLMVRCVAVFVLVLDRLVATNYNDYDRIIKICCKSGRRSG